MNIEDLTFRRCGADDIDSIMAIQDEAFALLDDASLLRRNSRDMLLECLSEPHYTVGAYHGGIMAGFGILFHGGSSDENLALLMPDCGLSYEQAANVKLIIVRRKFRGLGLQRGLISEIEDIARQRGYSLLCATVAPTNSFSLANFQKMDYNIYGEFSKYGGLARLLLYKYL